MTFITTSTGREVSFVSCSPDDIDIDDIITALPRLCRFTGHAKRFYSVAEHTILGVKYIEPQHKKEFLLHDAAEAYVGDLAKPLKQMMPQYVVRERAIDIAIRKKFDLPINHKPKAVYAMDLRLLATERRDLMTVRPGQREWDCLAGIKPLKQLIDKVAPDESQLRYQLSVLCERLL